MNGAPGTRRFRAMHEGTHISESRCGAPGVWLAVELSQNCDGVFASLGLEAVWGVEADELGSVEQEELGFVLHDTVEGEAVGGVGFGVEVE